VFLNRWAAALWWAAELFWWAVELFSFLLKMIILDNKKSSLSATKAYRNNKMS